MVKPFGVTFYVSVANSIGGGEEEDEEKEER
jgi:hypothetical protein